MQLSTRLQNLGLAVLAVLAASLTAYAVWSVGHRADVAAPTGDVGRPVSAAPAGDASATTSEPAGEQESPTTPAGPATASLQGWLEAWSDQDAELVVIGDGYSNLRSQWLQQWAIALAAERPVEVSLWAEAEDVRYNEPDVLSEGDGPALTIWNASRSGTTIAEAADHLEGFLGAAVDVDAVLLSLGRGSSGEDVAASLDQLVDQLDPTLPVLVLIGPPGLYSTTVTDGILAWAQDHEDRVALVDLRQTAPEEATAEEWAAAFQAALDEG